MGKTFKDRPDRRRGGIDSHGSRPVKRSLEDPDNGWEDWENQLDDNVPDDTVNIWDDEFKGSENA